MFVKDLMITKYPYLGSSPNLMEYFSIIGYDEITLANAKENKSNKINKNQQYYHQFVQDKIMVL